MEVERRIFFQEQERFPRGPDETGTINRRHFSQIVGFVSDVDKLKNIIKTVPTSKYCDFYNIDIINSAFLARFPPPCAQHVYAFEKRPSFRTDYSQCLGKLPRCISSPLFSVILRFAFCCVSGRPLSN